MDGPEAEPPTRVATIPGGGAGNGEGGHQGGKRVKRCIHVPNVKPSQGVHYLVLLAVRPPTFLQHFIPSRRDARLRSSIHQLANRNCHSPLSVLQAMRRQKAVRKKFRILQRFQMIRLWTLPLHPSPSALKVRCAPMVRCSETHDYCTVASTLCLPDVKCRESTPVCTRCGSSRGRSSRPSRRAHQTRGRPGAPWFAVRRPCWRGLVATATAAAAATGYVTAPLSCGRGTRSGGCGWIRSPCRCGACAGVVRSAQCGGRRTRHSDARRGSTGACRSIVTLR